MKRKVKSKRNLLTVMAAIAAICLGFAVSCGGNGDKTWTVTFDLNQGSGEFPALPVKDGKAVDEPTVDPTREDAEGVYEFLGWFISLTDDDAYDFETPVSGNLTLIAKWKDPTGIVELGQWVNIPIVPTEYTNIEIAGATVTELGLLPADALVRVNGTKNAGPPPSGQDYPMAFTILTVTGAGGWEEPLLMSSYSVEDIGDETTLTVTTFWSSNTTEWGGPLTIGKMLEFQTEWDNLNINWDPNHGVTGITGVEYWKEN